MQRRNCLCEHAFCRTNVQNVHSLLRNNAIFSWQILSVLELSGLKRAVLFNETSNASLCLFGAIQQYSVLSALCKQSKSIKGKQTFIVQTYLAPKTLLFKKKNTKKIN